MTPGGSMGGGGGGISPSSRISNSPKISSNSRLVRHSPMKSLNELKDEVRGIQASRTSMVKKQSSSTKGTGNKSRSAPADTGIPNSTKIDRDANGNITKYTTYGRDGKIVKEVRVDGKEHGSIPRPNVKEPTFNINPKTGQQFQNGYQVRPANPNEIPNSRK